MLFRVENLGPLREAEVDLSKRLIVLTGPNNTGKKGMPDMPLAYVACGASYPLSHFCG